MDGTIIIIIIITLVLIFTTICLIFKVMAKKTQETCNLKYSVERLEDTIAELYSNYHSINSKMKEYDREIDYLYSTEMINWDKTEELNKDKCNHDSVQNPSHYDGGGIHNIECYKAIEYILAYLENVPEKYYGHVSNIVKYIWRCNYKNGYEDLDKASVYFDFMFREEE